MEFDWFFFAVAGTARGAAPGLLAIAVLYFIPLPVRIKAPMPIGWKIASMVFTFSYASIMTTTVVATLAVFIGTLIEGVIAAGLTGLLPPKKRPAFLNVFFSLTPLLALIKAMPYIPS